VPVGLKLVDLRDGASRLADSGRFSFDFRVPAPGDLDGDNDVDGDDLAVLEASLGAPATGLDDVRDLDGDGDIDARDGDLLLRELRRSALR
jgi:hypothetical protein